MGLDANGTRFLLYARSLGVDFARTLMIGRQGLHLSPSALHRNLRRFGQPTSEADVQRMFDESDGYAEPFLRRLGADEVHALDYSDFEGASHVHDLNRPIPAELKNRYSVVLDGGSLEHVFDFPTAIRNCMEMVETGGHFLGITPANDFMGHGFYQFSPELYYRVFTEAQGYRPVAVLLCEDDPDATWYSVVDPEAVRGRVMARTGAPAYLLVAARKIEDRPAFETIPQQSDYTTAWEGPELDPAQRLRARGETQASSRLSRRVASRLAPLVPEFVKEIRRRALVGREPRYDPRLFTPLELPGEE